MEALSTLGSGRIDPLDHEVRLLCRHGAAMSGMAGPHRRKRHDPDCGRNVRNFGQTFDASIFFMSVRARHRDRRALGQSRRNQEALILAIETGRG